MSTNVTQTFLPATPFFAGSTSGLFTSVPPNAVALDNRIYSVDLAEYRHIGLQSFREGVVSSGEPSDQLFNPNGGWWRYRYDWSLGMGQPVADLDENVIGRRYDYSEGVDPWGNNALSLQHTFEEVQTFALGTSVRAPIFLKVQVGTEDYLVVSNGFSTYFIDKTGAIEETYNVGASFGVPFQITSASTNGFLLRMATVGNKLYTLYETNTGAPLEYAVGEFDITFDGGTSKLRSTWTAETLVPNNGKEFDLFAVAGNSLLVGVENVLYEYVPTASPKFQVLYTHPDTSFVWTTSFNIGSRIYVGGYGNEQSNLFGFTTTSTGNLALSSQATVFPNDEKLYGGFGYSGNAVMWTNRGIRFATLSGDGSLSYGGLIETDKPVTSAYPYQKHIWFNWDRDDGKMQLGRLSLEEFTKPLTPAYATDALSTASADVLNVHIATFIDAYGPTFGNPSTYTSPTIYVIADNNKLYKVASTYATTGYFTSGEIYFGTAENKSLGRVEARFDALQAGESVKCEVIDSETGQTIGQRIIAIEGEKVLTLTPQGTVFNRAYLKTTLQGNGSSTPTLRQWKISSFPIAPTTQQWQVPLIIGRTVLVGSGEGALVSYNPWDEIQFVRDLWHNRTVFSYTESEHSYRVRVDNFSVRPTKWDDSGEWLEIILTVVLLSVE